MKKKIISICLVVCLLATAIAGTVAYFTDVDAEMNQFVVGNVDIDLVEDFDDKTPLVPGEENLVKKIVNVENKSNVDAYVRLLIAYEDTKDVGQMAKINSAYADYMETQGVKREGEGAYVIPKGYNAEQKGDWLQIKDTVSGNVYTVAYITLPKALAPGESTADHTWPLMSAWSIKDGADNAWAEIVGEKYDVLVLAQGTQVVTGLSATESLDAAFFEMGYDADDEVAALFSEVYGGSFVGYDYDHSATDNWAPAA